MIQSHCGYSVLLNVFLFYCLESHNPFGSPLILLTCTAHGLENPELCFSEEVVLEYS